MTIQCSLTFRAHPPGTITDPDDGGEEVTVRGEEGVLTWLLAHPDYAISGLTHADDEPDRDVPHLDMGGA